MRTDKLDPSALLVRVIMPFLSKINAYLRRPDSRMEPAILMYHRVETVTRDPWGLAVSLENFCIQLDLLQSRRQVISLEDLVRLQREDRLPPSAVAITFDDGYRDNLLNAAPALTAAGFPATLFLATGPMRDHQEYWWDRLETMVFDTGQAHGTVRIAGHEIEINLHADEGAIPVRRNWRAYQPPLTERERLYIHLWSLIRRLAPDRVVTAMSDLNTIIPALAKPVNAPMTAEEVQKLLAESAICLGCHTVDHPDLTALSSEAVLQQLSLGKADVEQLAGRGVSALSYPYGRNSPRVRKLARAAGFTHACTTSSKAFNGSSAFSLPRRTAIDVPSIDWISS